MTLLDIIWEYFMKALLLLGAISIGLGCPFLLFVWLCYSDSPWTLITTLIVLLLVCVFVAFCVLDPDKHMKPALLFTIMGLTGFLQFLILTRIETPYFWEDSSPLLTRLLAAFGSQPLFFLIGYFVSGPLSKLIKMMKNDE